MAIKSVISRAPTRIDLAGGTVDLWPLFLFLDRPVTINIAIDLKAEVKLEESPAKSSNAGVVTLTSEDQKAQIQLPYSALLAQDNSVARALDIPPSLELHFKLLRHFVQKHGQDKDIDLSISTLASSPAGAGLGGSSTLSIALIGAIASWARNGAVDPLRDGDRLIEIARDIETTVIQVPAGLQDYYGAMFGGLQVLRWQVGSHIQKWLSHGAADELEDRILLFYSGQSRNSGINNWALFKALIDKEGEVLSKFERIVAATKKLEQALRNENWKDVGQAIAEEWEVRKTLAPGITTPEIDKAFAAAKKIAPVSGKVCGAGGGGCFFLYIPTEDKAERDNHKNWIRQTLKDQGIIPLPLQVSPQGLELQVTRA